MNFIQRKNSSHCQRNQKSIRLPKKLSAPTILHDPNRQRSPLFVGIMLGIIGANDFMQLSTSRSRESSRHEATSVAFQCSKSWNATFCAHSYSGEHEDVLSGGNCGHG